VRIREVLGVTVDDLLVSVQLDEEFEKLPEQRGRRP
jgi:hypothetical protein